LVPINRVCIIGNCTLSLNHAWYHSQPKKEQQKKIFFHPNGRREREKHP
jgi:hypothetical protein